MYPQRFIAVLLFAALVLGTQALFAQGGPDDAAPEDKAAIQSYVLTMPRVKAFAAAYAEYDKSTKDPSIEAESKKLEAQNVSMMKKVQLVETTCPHMNVWIKAHGMTAKEFMLIPMALITAGFAQVAIDQGGKPPAWVNPANIQFLKDHHAELEQLGVLGGKD